MTASFFLPDGYRENPVNITLDHGDGHYWDEDRVRRSAIHQFAVYSWAEKIIREKNVKTVADVGCGFAAKLAWLHGRCPDVSYWGIDQPHAAELCRRHYGFGQWVGVDFENDPAVPSARADLVISSDVIEHLQNPDVLLDYYRRVCAPDGLILISTPERDRLRGLSCRHSPNPYHVREWNREELDRYLKSRGFAILEHRVLPALGFAPDAFYLRKIAGRWLRGQTMRYNQAVLMRSKG